MGKEQADAALDKYRVIEPTTRNGSPIPNSQSPIANR
jgi:hypothetical protein